jgi:hypothetical protein
MSLDVDVAVGFIMGLSTVAVIIYRVWRSKINLVKGGGNTATNTAGTATNTAGNATNTIRNTATFRPITTPQLRAPELHVLLIEADNQRSLGGSCLRDCLTADKYLTNYLSQPSIKINKGCTMVLSIDDTQTNRMKFANNKNIIFDKLSNYKTRFTDFISKVAKNDTVLILISGHGYQQKSKTKEEVDGLDEYIRHDKGIILDNELNELLLKKLTAVRRVICLADTCHSGTIFDNSNYTNIFSISACLDKQYASCDIGVVTGYGGALTVHLFDQSNASNILIAGNISDIRNLVAKISKIVAPLKQTPLYVGPAILPL